MRNLYFIVLGISICFLVSCKSSKTKPSEVNQNKKHKESAKGNIHENNEKVDKVIAATRSYIGTPYKYGGTSRAGFDCSGLMWICFKEANIDLPRTSTEQSKIGTAIAYKDLKPGDLVFFTDKKGGSKVVHVGIVSKVNGVRDVKFIHSSTKLGVVESDLYVSYYESILIKANRVIN